MTVLAGLRCHADASLCCRETWERRWIVLTTSSMLVYKDETAATRGGRPIFAIEIASHGPVVGDAGKAYLGSPSGK